MLRDQVPVSDQPIRVLKPRTEECFSYRVVTRRLRSDGTAQNLVPSEARVLVHPSRQRVVQALSAHPDGLTVAQLANAVGVRSNTVRLHLEVLLRAGVVSAKPAPPTGHRGRPSNRYLLAQPDAVAAVGHRELVQMLLELVRRAGVGEEEVEVVGWGRGERQVPREASVKDAVAMLSRLGFAPADVTSAAQARTGARHLRLWACPFKDAVLAEGGELICALHRGLVRGALERAAAELTTFEPKDPVSAGCIVGIAAPPPR